MTATSVREYRVEALRRVMAWAGGDGGLVHRHFPTTAPFETGIYEGMDPHYARRCVAGWDVQYGRDMAPVVRWSVENGRPSMDFRSLGEKSRLAFYADIITPSHIREGVLSTIELGGELMAFVILNLGSREHFSDATVELVRSLLPFFALGDRLLAKRGLTFDDDVCFPRLTPREREVAELVALGYTNREIALALASSVHTVRNQVASVFRKAGASTRAELVGLMRPRAG